MSLMTMMGIHHVTMGQFTADLILAGNSTGVSRYQGAYDASYGTVLEGDGANNFSSIQLTNSGTLLHGEVRDIKTIKVGGVDFSWSRQITEQFAGMTMSIYERPKSAIVVRLQTQIALVSHNMRIITALSRLFRLAEFLTYRRQQ
jgi:hypothetical protein